VTVVLAISYSESGARHRLAEVRNRSQPGPPGGVEIAGEPVLADRRRHRPSMPWDLDVSNLFIELGEPRDGDLRS
jgi:hypothetical protein